MPSICLHLLTLLVPRPLRSSPFPYTTLFRSLVFNPTLNHSRGRFTASAHQKSNDYVLQKNSLNPSIIHTPGSPSNCTTNHVTAGGWSCPAFGWGLKCS